MILKKIKIRNSFLVFLILGLSLNFSLTVFAATTNLTVTVTSGPAVCGDGSCNGDESCSTCSSDCGTCPSTGGGGGGGGGGGYTPPATSVILQGKAYSNASLTVLKDGQVIVMTKADSSADFKITLTTLTAGIYTFGIWAEDEEGRKSITFSFTVTVTSGTTTTISGIFIPPTINLSKESVKRGEILDIYGQTAPESEIDIRIYSGEVIKESKADQDGNWDYSLDTAILSEGSHTTKAKSSLAGLMSTFSQIVSFNIGQAIARLIKKADTNRDDRVDLTDFSILLFNWGQPTNLATDYNSDGRVNIVDFSIMLYWWTG